MRIGVTGAGGFVGRALLDRLQALPATVVPIVRTPAGLANECVVGDLASLSPGDLPPLDALVHLAALAHITVADAVEAEARFHRANVIGTERVMRAGLAAGISRVVFVSSVKVNGERTRPNMPFTERDAPMPEDAYGRSKWQAEQRVAAICSETGIRYTILRPPLVYGRYVGANFRKLAMLARSPVPLPLGGIRNARSLVHVGNLVDAIAHLAVSAQAIDETYLISDGQDVSTSELLRMLAAAQGGKLRLLPASPVRWLTNNRRLAGLHNRLFTSLQVDSSKLREQIGWEPPLTLEAALAESFGDQLEAG